MEPEWDDDGANDDDDDNKYNVNSLLSCTYLVLCKYFTHTTFNNIINNFNNNIKLVLLLSLFYIGYNMETWRG